MLFYQQATFLRYQTKLVRAKSIEVPEIKEDVSLRVTALSLRLHETQCNTTFCTPREATGEI
jgi:hypothetical protein